MYQQGWPLVFTWKRIHMKYSSNQSGKCVRILYFWNYYYIIHGPMSQYIRTWASNIQALLPPIPMLHCRSHPDHQLSDWLAWRADLLCTCTYHLMQLFFIFKSLADTLFIHALRWCVTMWQYPYKMRLEADHAPYSLFLESPFGQEPFAWVTAILMKSLMCFTG